MKDRKAKAKLIIFRNYLDRYHVTTSMIVNNPVRSAIQHDLAIIGVMSIPFIVLGTKT